MAQYPIYHQPTEALLKQVAQAAGPGWAVTELNLVEWQRSRWSAQFRFGPIDNIHVEMSLGGAEPSRKAMEERLIKFLTDE